MAQRYISTGQHMGVNLYDTYPDTTTIATGQISNAGPTKMKQLGIQPGLRVSGSFNTTWLFCTVGTATTALTAGTAVNIDGTTFQANTSTGGISGKPLVTVPASASAVGTGFWAETSGATLNLTPLTAQAGEVEYDDEWPHAQRGIDKGMESSVPSRHGPAMGPADEKFDATGKPIPPGDKPGEAQAKHPLPPPSPTTPTAHKNDHGKDKHA